MFKIVIVVVILVACFVGLGSMIQHGISEIGDQYCADARVREQTFQKCLAEKTCTASVDDTVRMERDKRLCK